jgi:hypothetical protein
MVRLVGRVGQRLLWLGDEGLVAAAGVLLGAEELVLCERDKVILHVLDGPVRESLGCLDGDRPRDRFREAVKAERAPEVNIHRIYEVAGDVDS